MHEELPSIETIKVEKPKQPKTKKKVTPAKAKPSKEVNETSTSVKAKRGPLYAYRTNVNPEDDKNRTNIVD